MSVSMYIYIKIYRYFVGLLIQMYMYLPHWLDFLNIHIVEHCFMFIRKKYDHSRISKSTTLKRRARI